VSTRIWVRPRKPKSRLSWVFRLSFEQKSFRISASNLTDWGSLHCHEVYGKCLSLPVRWYYHAVSLERERETGRETMFRMADNSCTYGTQIQRLAGTAVFSVRAIQSHCSVGAATAQRHVDLQRTTFKWVNPVVLHAVINTDRVMSNTTLNCFVVEVFLFI
jgi:hypothetical protein